MHFTLKVYVLLVFFIGIQSRLVLMGPMGHTAPLLASSHFWLWARNGTMGPFSEIRKKKNLTAR